MSPGYHATGDFNGLGCFEMGAKCNGLAGKPRMQAVDITVHLCFIEKQAGGIKIGNKNGFSSASCLRSRIIGVHGNLFYSDTILVGYQK